MKLGERVTRQLCKGVANLAIGFGKISVNSNCELWIYQPKVPKTMEEFKKKDLK